MSSDTDEVSVVYDRLRAVQVDGASLVESLANFMRERAALEEQYSKNLKKLSKLNLVPNEKTTNPALYEALASLRGDVANESMQHSELASAMTKDVLEPLARLKDGSDSVARISAEAKRVTKDVKAAYERCRKVFDRYVKAHKKAVDLSVAVGLEPPVLWLPPELEYVRRESAAPRESPPHSRSPTSGAAAAAAGAGPAGAHRPAAAVGSRRTSPAAVPLPALATVPLSAPLAAAIASETPTPVELPPPALGAAAQQTQQLGDGAPPSPVPVRTALPSSGDGGVAISSVSLADENGTTPSDAAPIFASTLAAAATHVAVVAASAKHPDATDSGGEMVVAPRNGYMETAPNGVMGELPPPAENSDFRPPDDSNPLSATVPAPSSSVLPALGDAAAASAADGPAPVAAPFLQGETATAEGVAAPFLQGETATAEGVAALFLQGETASAEGVGAPDLTAAAADSVSDAPAFVDAKNALDAAEGGAALPLGPTAPIAVAAPLPLDAAAAPQAEQPQPRQQLHGDDASPPPPHVELDDEEDAFPDSSGPASSSPMFSGGLGPSRHTMGRPRPLASPGSSSALRTAVSMRSVHRHMHTASSSAGSAAAGATAPASAGSSLASGAAGPAAGGASSRGASFGSGSMASSAAPPYHRGHYLGASHAGDDDAASVATSASTENLSVALAVGRVKGMFSSSALFNLSALVGTPAYIGPATQSTADRIAAMRASAGEAVEAAAGAEAECREAWATHARAKAAFTSQITAAVTVFTELERRRVSEMCDAMRRYTVFASSMLANLQYDVNRLATVVEDSGAIATSSAPSISVPMIGLATQRMDAALTAFTAGRTSSSGGGSGGGLQRALSGLGPGGRAGEERPPHVAGASAGSQRSGGGEAGAGEAHAHARDSTARVPLPRPAPRPQHSSLAAAAAAAVAADAQGVGDEEGDDAASTGAASDGGRDDERLEEGGEEGGGDASDVLPSPLPLLQAGEPPLSPQRQQRAPSPAATAPSPHNGNGGGVGHARSSSEAVRGFFSNVFSPSAAATSSSAAASPPRVGADGGAGERGGDAISRSASSSSPAALASRLFTFGRSAPAPAQAPSMAGIYDAVGGSAISLTSFTNGLPTASAGSGSGGSSHPHGLSPLVPRSERVRVPSNASLPGGGSGGYAAAADAIAAAAAPARRPSASGLPPSTGGTGGGEDVSVPRRHLTAPGGSLEGGGSAAGGDAVWRSGSSGLTPTAGATISQRGAPPRPPVIPSGTPGASAALPAHPPAASGGGSGFGRLFAGLGRLGAAPSASAAAPAPAGGSSSAAAEAPVTTAAAASAAQRRSRGSSLLGDLLAVPPPGSAIAQPTAPSSRRSSLDFTWGLGADSAAVGGGGTGTGVALLASGSRRTAAAPSAGPPGSGGLSVSISLMGSSRGSRSPSGLSAASSAGGDASHLREAAATMSRLVEPGPVEAIVAALFAPAAPSPSPASAGRSEEDAGASSTPGVTAFTLTAFAGVVEGAPTADAAPDASSPAVHSPPLRLGPLGALPPGAGVSGEEGVAAVELPAEEGALAQGDADAPTTAPVVLVSGSGSGIITESPMPPSGGVTAPDAAAPQLTPPPSPAAAAAAPIPGLHPSVPGLLPAVLRALRTSPDGLARLVTSLDARRADGSSPLARPALDVLWIVIAGALDTALKRGDVVRARSLMLASQTFYCLIPSGAAGAPGRRGSLGPVTSASQPPTAASARPGRLSARDYLDPRIAALLAPLPAEDVPLQFRSDPSSAVVALPPTGDSSLSGEALDTAAAPSGGVQQPGPAAPSSRGSRLYLQTRIRGHAMWQDNAFWESSVYDALGAELSIGGGTGQAAQQQIMMAHHGAASSSSSTAAAGGGDALSASIRGMGTIGEPRGDKEQAVLRGQLGFFAFNMISFNVPAPRVKALLDKYARFMRLGPAEAASLMASVDGFEAEHRRRSSGGGDTLGVE